MIRQVEIAGVMVWFTIDQLRTYEIGNRENIIEHDEYICYFKFAEPNHIYGELLRRENGGVPILFDTVDEAIEHGTNYVRRAFHLA